MSSPPPSPSEPDSSTPASKNECDRSEQPPSSSRSNEMEKCPLLVSDPTAQPVPSSHTSPDQPGSSTLQQDHVVKLRDLLVDLFQGLDRHPRWYSLMEEIAEGFETLHSQQVDCSELVDAVPPDGDELEVRMPVSDLKQLEGVRRSFMAMAPHVTTYIEAQSQKRHFSFKDRWTTSGVGAGRSAWLLEQSLGLFRLLVPAVLRYDPWIRRTVSEPYTILSKQTELLRDPDTALYMITLDRMYQPNIHLPFSMSDAHLRDEHEDDKSSMYYAGRSTLQDHLGVCHGIRIRPRKQEPAIPFPWLDCKLSRLKSLDWELERGAEDYDVLDGPSWSVDYHDGLDHLDSIRGVSKSRHFEPHSLRDLLLTNVRVPLPRRILEDPPSLGSAMYQLYGEYHPLKMLGEARNLVTDLGGIFSDDVDIKAAMLYLVIKRISNANPSVFSLLLDHRGNEDGDQAETTEDNQA